MSALHLLHNPTMHPRLFRSKLRSYLPAFLPDASLGHRLRHLLTSFCDQRYTAHSAASTIITVMTTKQMSDACETFIAAEVTLTGGIPSIKMPDGWPDYDVITQQSEPEPPQFAARIATILEDALRIRSSPHRRVPEANAIAEVPHSQASEVSYQLLRNSALGGLGILSVIADYNSYD